MFLFIFPLISLLVGSGVAMGDVCSAPKSTDDVLQCLNLNHPDIKKTTVDAKLAEGVVKTATQFPNPQFNFYTLNGKTLGETRGESQYTFSQLIEISGKRGARARVGEATAEAIRANSALSKDLSRIDNVLRLVRYRQLLTEIEVLEEALETFGKVNRQFASRPKLSPDQQVSSGIFKLAAGDYSSRMSGLLAEKNQLDRYFKIITELSFSEAAKVLPKRWKDWPKAETFQGDLKQSPRFRGMEANLKHAKANNDFARAGSWPDPTVSVLVQDEVEGWSEFRRVGVGVSLPLPLWNVNGGERGQAAAMEYKAEVDYQAGTKALEVERSNLISNYQGYVTSLNQSPDLKDMHRKHQDT
ncbi:MAG: hypothetical protein K2X47_14260, partial [Bdellovibrionales bacterium]|nr:hypothetical protein [Bdellovibrionales bacterium]